jgi:hypothetical protein
MKYEVGTLSTGTNFLPYFVIMPQGGENTHTHTHTHTHTIHKPARARGMVILYATDRLHNRPQITNGIAGGPEVNHSTPYRIEVKNEWSYVSAPLHACMEWKGKFYFLLFLSNPREKWHLRRRWGPLYVRTTVQTGLNLTNSGI